MIEENFPADRSLTYRVVSAAFRARPFGAPNSVATGVFAPVDRSTAVTCPLRASLM